MCVMSMVGDNFKRDWERQWAPRIPDITQTTQTTYEPFVTQADFRKLQKEIEALKDLLIAAKLYDEKTGQKDCEMEEKVAFLRSVAEFVGVDLEEVFGS